MISKSKWLHIHKDTQKDDILDTSTTPAYTFPYQLDDFQQIAINSIEKNEDVLVSVPTGAGKTTVCLYAIAYSLNNNKKIVYTSPIKSLSNQKFKEFKDKLEPIYGHGTIGILTGDIKFNPDARCIIMTTEILRNLLYRQGTAKIIEKQEPEELEHPETTADIALANINLEEIGCVVFDEVHYINDQDRGKVWEETIIMLPPRILLVMLSATIDKPEKFATWIGDLKQKPIHLVTSKFRPVPLNHFIFSFNKVEQQETENIGRLFRIMNEKNIFSQAEYDNSIRHYKNQYYDQNGKIIKIKGQSRQMTNIEKNNMQYASHKLNDFFIFLRNKELLPALVFVLSRKNCEKYASQISTANLVTSKESAEINKIFNYHIHPYIDQYSKLYQFTMLQNLLQQGIGVHHSGLIPILKEIVEILFATGLIKILFCTETFAVGVNMPTKTVVFTELMKYDGYEMRKRYLKTDEYLQMAGRAGRRGLDTIGTVIHFPLYGLPKRITLQDIMTGKTPEILSKFTLNYQFILKVIESDSHNLLDFINMSLLSTEKNNYLESKIKEYKTTQDQNNNQKDQKIEKKIYKKIKEYHRISGILNSGFKMKQKEYKNYKKRQTDISKDPLFKENYHKFQANNQQKNYEKSLENEITYLQSENIIEVTNILYFLQEFGYLKLIDDLDLILQDTQDIQNIQNKFMKILPKLDRNILQLKGIIGSQISECNEIILTEILSKKIINSHLKDEEIVAILAIFVEEKNGDKGQKSIQRLRLPKHLVEKLSSIIEIIDKLESREESYGIELETDWNIYTEFIEPAYMWAKGKTIGKIYEITNIYEGNFIKDILKLSHLAESLMTLAEIIQDQELSKKAAGISKNLIRDEVITNSLYIK